MTLHQVYTSDRERIVRSVFAEDLEYLKIQSTFLGNALDNLVEECLNTMSDTSRFFKVETDSGALVGFFAIADPMGSENELEVFHIRRGPFRHQQVVDLWWELISSMFSNRFYASVSANNYLAKAHLLKNNFTVSKFKEVNGKNFVIFMHSNN